MHLLETFRRLVDVTLFHSSEFSDEETVSPLLIPQDDVRDNTATPQDMSAARRLNVTFGASLHL